MNYVRFRAHVLNRMCISQEEENLCKLYLQVGKENFDSVPGIKRKPAMHIFLESMPVKDFLKRVN